MAEVRELWRIPPEKEGVPIYTVAFKPPDGSLVAAAKGKRLLVCNAANGELVQKLKGHKGIISSLSFSNDGSLLASGAADNSTIIWDKDGNGMLRFNHETSIQSVAFNPIDNKILASCASGDFGIWSSATNKVSKYQVDSKILDCAWSRDGTILALAHESGYVSLFNNNESKIIATIGQGNVPVCCVEWIPSKRSDQLVFGSEKCLSFYDFVAKKIVKTQDIGFLPCSLSFTGGQLVTSGSGGALLELANVVTEPNWVWSASSSPTGDKLFIGTEDGSIAMYTIDYDAPLAIELCTRLQNWDRARQLADETGCVKRSIITGRQADWTLHNDSLDAAVAVFVDNNDYLNAINLVVSKKPDDWKNAILSIVRESKCDNDSVIAAENAFVLADAQQHLPDLFRSCNDHQKLLRFYIKSRNWVEANKVLDEHGEDINGGADLLRAQLLVMQGKFVPAFESYLKIGRFDMAQKIMIELSNSAALMNEFKDASHNLWMIANAVRGGQCEGTASLAKDLSNLMLRSEAYYLYHVVHLSHIEPFPTTNPETLLNAAALLYNGMSFSRDLIGISLPTILSTLGNMASSLGANHTAKICLGALERLQSSNSDGNSTTSLHENLTADNDNSDLLPVCYSCGFENSLIRQDTSSDTCTHCGQAFIRCFINLDVLPLVEFKPLHEISDEEAIGLIVNHESSSKSRLLFDQCIQQSLEDQRREEEKVCPMIAVGYDVLASLDREEIFVVRAKSNTTRFFKNVLPEIGIALCPECDHFFHEEDFEFAVLRDGGCPFCRCNVIGKSYGHL